MDGLNRVSRASEDEDGDTSEGSRPSRAFGKSGFVKNSLSDERVAADPAAPNRRRAMLSRAIEGEIVPRLLSTRRAALEGRDATGALAERVEGFARQLIDRGIDEALAEIERWRTRGFDLASIYLDLLAPAARHLGDLWLADRCTFADVTLALCRLQQILRHHGRSFEAEAHPRTDMVGRILLATVPGEQHSLGILMLDEFFRRAEWDVTCLVPSTRGDLLDLVSKEWFAVVGLSLAVDGRLPEVASLVAALRRASRNRHVIVLVGGAAFIDRPDRVAAVGAEGSAIDGRQAIGHIQHLIRAAARGGDAAA